MGMIDASLVFTQKTSPGTFCNLTMNWCLHKKVLLSGAIFIQIQKQSCKESGNIHVILRVIFILAHILYIF